MRASTVVLGCSIGLGLGGKYVYNLLRIQCVFIFCSLVMLVAQCRHNVPPILSGI